MKLTPLQLQNYCDWIYLQLEGAQLQDLWSDGENLFFEFYLRQKSQWLCFCLGQTPDMVLLSRRPARPKVTKPLTLFMQAHAKNLRLHSLQVQADLGRVIRLDLTARSEQSQRQCLCTATLINGNSNFSVQAWDPESGEKPKEMHWKKPRPLPTMTGEFTQPASQDLDAQDWSQYGAHLFSRGPQKTDAPLAAAAVSPDAREKKFTKVVEKKSKALQGIQVQIAQQKKLQDQYQSLAKILQYTSQVPKDLPPDLTSLYQSKLPLAQNREISFQKSKDLQRKWEGAEGRSLQLQNEIQQLQQAWQAGQWEIIESMAGGASKAAQGGQEGQANRLLQKSGSKARKLTLDQDLQAVIGKSAKDNLAILRQARAWDYWLHLRDYPGAHAVLLRNKNQSVSDAQLLQVAQWLVRETLAKKQMTQGISIAVLVAECRHVKPIKGSPGLVNYHNERVLHFLSKD